MADHRICSVEGCDKTVVSRQMCDKHYKRFRKHGSTEVRLRCATGERRAWLEAHVAHAADDCLSWPYSRYPTGFGQITVGSGANGTASREMCELAHGAPPSPTHQAAHSCGRGHEGCVNPKHLRWATQAENMADKLIHDTHARGERQWQSKLTEDDVRRIRSLKGSQTQRAIAAEYGIHQATVSEIQTGRKWGWLV